MLHIHNLKKKFDTIQAVDNVSFDVQRGQVLGFLGENGAGKTTTMRMLTGYIKPDSGSITICNQDAIENKVTTQKMIGYLPEGAPLYGDMTAAEYLYFIGQIRQMTSKDLTESFERIIEQTMLSDILYRPIDGLSKGFKRRVGLAAALLTDPPILILDEPTDGLDPNQKHHIRQLIQKLSTHKAIIISTHILEEVDAICTDTVIIHNGKIISYATPKELIAQSSLYNAVSIIIETAAAEKAAALLKTKDIIGNVYISGQFPKWTKLMIHPKDKAYILAEVAHMLNKEKWQVAGIHAERGSLEGVFRQLTTQNSAHIVSA